MPKKKKRGRQTQHESKPSSTYAPQASASSSSEPTKSETISASASSKQTVNVEDISPKIKEISIQSNEINKIQSEPDAIAKKEGASSSISVVTIPLQEQKVKHVPPPSLVPEQAKRKSQKTMIVLGAGGSVGATSNQMQPPHVEPGKKNYGTDGRKIAVHANHFEMKINIPNGMIYHYDVQFHFPWKREVRKADRPFLIKVIEALKRKYGKDVMGSPSSIVFDGLKNIYTCQKMNFPSGEFIGTVSEKQDAESVKEIEMTVKVKFVSSVDTQHAVEEYMRRGTTATRPNNSIQALNIILGMTPQLKFETLGRSYFNPVKEANGVIDLGGGKSLWVGTFQSVRLGWKPMLNVDMANKPAYEQSPITTFVNTLLAPPVRGPRHHPSARPPNELKEIPDKKGFRKVEDELKQLKIKFLRPDGQKREYRINKLMERASILKMKQDDGKVLTIQQYFQQQYNFTLKYPNLPCLHVGDPKKTIYLPMELCELKKQVAPRSKMLSDDELANMIRKTAMPPAERKKKILSNLSNLNDGFKEDPYAKAFGISVSNNMAEIQARVLQPPSLKYKNQQSMQDTKFQGVKDGKWHMGLEKDREKFMFVKGMQINRWGLLDLANVKNEEKSRFVDALYAEGHNRGLEIDFPKYGRADDRSLPEVEKEFKRLYEDLKSTGKPDLIMILVFRKSQVYSWIKHLGDVCLKIPTQFIMKKTMFGRDGKPSSQTLHNICLKLNSKLQGVNQTLFSRPKIMNRPIMIMGADVTHPSPGDLKKKPSIAAVVASCDPNASQYNTEVRLQYDGQVVEVIKQMEEITVKLLKKFNERTKYQPERILFYRDGVSEGQFLEVLNCEMSAIRRACTSLNKNYKPQITFLVAQKRHKTRLFPVNERDGVGKMKNVPPGTVVDTVITHPTEYDFFLASHEGIQGTTKPTHYHLLWDDSHMPPDELQTLTYHLCHLYSRCERSVSYPAPTYYAHLAAFRAREHHNALLDKAGGKEIAKSDIEKIENLDIVNYFI